MACPVHVREDENFRDPWQGSGYADAPHWHHQYFGAGVEQAGKRVLVIEDNSILAMALEETLIHLGHQIAGTAHTLEDGERLARAADCDFAVVDIDLHGRDAFPVVDILHERNIAYVLATGLPHDEIPAPYNQAYIVSKPYDMRELKRALAQAGTRGG
jgi:CheY-like chemotaxis protein